MASSFRYSLKPVYREALRAVLEREAQAVRERTEIVRAILEFFGHNVESVVNVLDLKAGEVEIQPPEPVLNEKGFEKEAS